MIQRKVFPGYEASILAKMTGSDPAIQQAKQEHFEAVHSFTFTDEYRVTEYMIPGVEGCGERKLRIIALKDLEPGAPMILDIHGGAWISEGIEGDNFRAANLAKAVPAVVGVIDYHGSKKEGIHFPIPLMECAQAYQWMIQHAEEIGGDPNRIGIHGSSSGANFAAGLALYLRDKEIQTPRLTVLNCPCVSTHVTETQSFWQYRDLHPGNAAPKLIVESIYLGGFDGTTPNYWAFPAEACSFEQLGPHFVITAEYDTLRDDGLQYAMKLFSAGVPTELYSAPRVGHCFTGKPHPFTDQINELMATSFRREFDMLG